MIKMVVEPLRCSYCGAPLKNYKCAYCGTLHTKAESTSRIVKTCFKHWTKYRQNLILYTSDECPECVKKRERDLEYDRKLRERNEKEEKDMQTRERESGKTSYSNSVKYSFVTIGIPILVGLFVAICIILRTAK